MNARLFHEMTGKQARTPQQSAELYAKRDAELRTRLAGLPKVEAVALCHKLIASEVMDSGSKIICIQYLDNR